MLCLKFLTCSISRFWYIRFFSFPGCLKCGFLPPHPPLLPPPAIGSAHVCAWNFNRSEGVREREGRAGGSHPVDINDIFLYYSSRNRDDSYLLLLPGLMHSVVYGADNSSLGELGMAHLQPASLF